jgi:magnesium chelatase subunit D
MRSATPDIPPPPAPPPPPEEESDEQQAPPEPDQTPPDETPPDADGDEDTGEGSKPEPPPATGEASPDDAPSDVEPQENEAPPGKTDGSEATDEIQEVGATYAVRSIERQSKDHVLRTGSGRRSRSRSASKQGRYIKATPRRSGRNDLALDATLRAAAPFQKLRRLGATRDLAVHVTPDDIREKIRERRIGNFLLFVVDGSGSMGARRRMVETKAAIMSLLLDAYQKRDKVAMVSFRGRTAEIVLPPTNSVERAARLLEDLPIGGRTPLTAGLAEAAGVLRQVLRKEPAIMPLVILMTDGRANAAVGAGVPRDEALRAAGALAEQYPNAQFAVVDTESPGVVRLDLARQIALALGATYFKVEDLRAEDLVSIAKEHQA